MNRAQSPSQDYSIIALDQFIQATRDSGYKGTASAVSELVDNSIQASATTISISITACPPSEEDPHPIEMSVLDDGCGMDPFTLRQALRFGGSTRFGDRKGLGRYGMGLPNASLSQARRVTVDTWQAPGKTGSRKSTRRSKKIAPERVFSVYLDVNEIVRGELREVPRPKISKTPPAQCLGPSGTLVRWSHCDRLDNRRVSTLSRKLASELGRRFRHFIWKGLEITVNGDPVKPFDPMYMHPKSTINGALSFGDTLRYEIRSEGPGEGETGWVEVKFSELPVRDWFKLSNKEKRQIGISRGSGVSLVRAGREVDSGWFFMGSKRRENYDDWWRCEVHFDPVLDEAFGITHTKQQVRPQTFLLEALTPDIETTARVLNARARKAHAEARAGDRFSEAERVAASADRLLRPLPNTATPKARALMREIEHCNPALFSGNSDGDRYRIVEQPIKETAFYSFAFDGEKLVLVINPDHPFYREIYKPLVDSDLARDHQLRVKLELMLLAAARAEVVREGKVTGSKSRGFTREWSDVLATFLNC